MLSRNSNYFFFFFFIETYAAARDRNLAGALESESAVSHMANLKEPRQRVPVMREDSPAETSVDRKPIDGGRKRQPTRQPTLLAPPTPTPPPKLQKRVAEIRPYVQEVDFDYEVSDDGFTPLPFFGNFFFILYFRIVIFFRG